ncbi:hypothetical protein GGX14DRAFT_560953 [Mycena pura]|uniref:Peptide hydrolase n=1 Tax=Mycena pura TaxID=153505 RepID=A0AAD6VS79_9AGAR|nr:hypothetical protein GGX14DRAFT_560953 [Mycena pura]
MVPDCRPKAQKQDTKRKIILALPANGTWQQISIIIRIAPPTALGSDPITILAHIDSINRDEITLDLPAPGASDDGSGTVTIL